MIPRDGRISQTLFVIEDDTHQIEWIKLNVESSNLKVISVDIDRASIEHAALNASSRDTFLIDILLNSDIDGLAVTEILADSGFAGAIVFISSTGADYLPLAQRLAEGRGLRVTAVIEKPLLPHQLFESVFSNDSVNNRPTVDPTEPNT